MMTPTPIWLSGFEYGFNPTVNGGGLFNVISGVPTVVTSPVRSGSYALRIAPAASTIYAERTIALSNVLVGRTYFRFNTLPSATCSILRATVTLGTQMILDYDYGTGKMIMKLDSNSPQLSSMVISSGAWYQLDFRFTVNTNPRTIDWKIDSADQAQSSNAETGSTSKAFRFGTGSTAYTFECFFDDAFLSSTSGDYPIGAGSVLGKSPNADGTHNAGTDVMENQAGADIGVVTAWDLLDNVPMNTTADYVCQAINGTGNYAEVQFADITQTTINGVSAILAYNSATATANNGATIIRRSDSTEISVYGTPVTPADMSESSLFYKSVIVTPPGGGWTQAEVNALRARMGYSGDANPDPYWQALMLEVDVVAANTVYQDLQAKWDMRQLVSLDLQAKYDMRVLVNQDLQAKWDMRVLVGQNLQSLWDMIGVVSNSLQAVWDMRALVNQDLQAKFDITTLVNKDLQGLWDLRNLVNQNLQAKYDIAMLVNKDLQALWDIASQNTLVNKDLQALWDITQLVNKDLQAVWDVRNLVNKDVQSLWDVRNFVSQDTQSLWDVLNFVNQSLQTQYDITNLVGQDLQAKYDVNGLVWQNLQSKWDLGGILIVTLTAKWRLGVETGKKKIPLSVIVWRR